MLAFHCTAAEEVTTAWPQISQNR